MPGVGFYQTGMCLAIFPHRRRGLNGGTGGKFSTKRKRSVFCACDVRIETTGLCVSPGWDACLRALPSCIPMGWGGGEGEGRGCPEAVLEGQDFRQLAEGPVLGGEIPDPGDGGKRLKGGDP